MDKKILIWIFGIILLSSFVSAVEGDIIFEDGAETGSFGTNWVHTSGSGGSYDSAQVHAGTKSIDSNGGVINNITNSLL